MEEQVEKSIGNMTRRYFFSRSSRGIGIMALASLLNKNLFTASSPLTNSRGILKRLHFAPKAKRIIYLFQSGAPSQLDLFDHKPKLAELSGQPMPESFTKGQRIAQLRDQELTCMGSKFKFQRYGQSGAELSELLPHTSKVADDITIIRSVHTDAINHDPAVTLIQTGGQQPGRPTMGSWFSYGLGSENDQLPSYIVLTSGYNGQPLLSRYWGSGFLPSSHQGVEFRSTGDPVLFISNPPGINPKTRRRILDGLHDLNQHRLGKIGDPEIMTRIQSYEMAFRMQTSVPELTDLSQEPKKILERYGAEPGKASFANNCLLARRLAERDVRFIQLYHRGWDHHFNLPTRVANQCRETDRPSDALVQDLKERGMLDETLVIWAGEFGRTPMNQGNMTDGNYGRDHHMKAFTIWMAGGGIKPGITIGETDEPGYNPIEDPVHINDLQATILHCMGIDHEKLTYRFQGRDFRLTDVGGQVIQKALA